MKLDAHQHFWTLSHGYYSWLSRDLRPIYRDFSVGDLRPLLERHGIKGTVLVQAAAATAETEFLLSIAEAHTFVKGVVGWVDFDANNATQAIYRAAIHPKICGLRPMIQDIADLNWMLQPHLRTAFEAMIECELSFDALVQPKHLPNLLALLSKHPTLQVVIDHAAKPDICNQSFDNWALHMRQIAYDTNAFCKLSGLVTEAAANWCPDDLRPFVAHLLDTFGPSRLIWGSDWPVCTLATTYDRWYDTTQELLHDLTSLEIEAVLGRNAMTAYRLSP